VVITEGGGIWEEKTYKDNKVKKERVGGFGGTVSRTQITIDKDFDDPDDLLSRIYHESIHRGQPEVMNTPGDYAAWEKARDEYWEDEVEAYLAEANWQLSVGMDPRPDFLDRSGKPDAQKIRDWVKKRPEYQVPYIPGQAEIAAAKAGAPPPPPPAGGKAPPPVKFPIVRRS